MAVQALVVAAGLAIGSLQADIASAESLRDAAASAYRYNPRLDAERARQRATDEEVARANSGYRPTISGTADIGYNRTDTHPGRGADLNPRG
ncbi:MAG: channel protein TolC, partial [Hyphomicrobiaceae bacterium]